jgi:glyoxylase-like metal-dependent hydrolase (beta-lactamase superfamily II)
MKGVTMARILCRLPMLALLMSPPLVAQEAASSIETPSEQSQDRARSVVRRAADAFGGAEALLAIKAIRISAKSKSTPRLQSPSPEPPFGDATNESDVMLDLQNKRLSLRNMDDEGGVLRRSLTLIGAGDPRIYNLHARTFRPFPSPPSFDRELAVHSRRSPQLLLRQALVNPLQLRFLGEATFDNRLHDIVSVPMSDGVQAALFLDRATGLISKVETLYFDTLAGNSAEEIIFKEYAGQGVARSPRSVRVTAAGQETLRTELSIEIDPATEQAFAFDATGYQPVRASQPFPERVEQLAEGIYLLHSVSDPAHNALAVEFADFIVVVDAPDSSEGGERLIRKINAIIPGKPIRFVVASHHHEDHIGGLRPFIASGARVVITAGNRSIVEALAAAPHEDRLSANPAPLRLETIRNGRYVFSDGRKRMELIDVGPNPHAKEILIAYFPQERIVYQTDLFGIPSNEAPVGPAPASYVAFAKAIDRLKLDVGRIAGGHGRTATVEEFRERIAVRNPGG